MSKKKKTEANHQRVRELADKAADAVFAHAFDYSEMIEHADTKWHAVQDYFAETDSAYITSEGARELDSMARAMYAIGIAVGRRLGGVR